MERVYHVATKTGSGAPRFRAFPGATIKNALQEIEDLTLEITQHTAEIQQLQDVLQGYSSLLHDVTADRDRFREDWQAMVRELSRWRPQTKGNE
jgi:DNA repair exonuclease SbcCD ATPase subunit